MSTIHELEETLRQRRAARPTGSYSAELFGDPELIQRKVMEEAFETCLEMGRPTPDPARVASEAADLLFHVLVGLVHCEVSVDDVVEELARRQR